MDILLVEDNEILSKGLIYTLKQNDFNVISAKNVNEAKNYLKEKKVDIIILDIFLPDGDGINFYEKEIKHKEIPTIFLTAKDDEETIVKGLEIGADDYITKPFSTKELIARINKIFNKGKKNLTVKIKNIEFDLDKMVVYKEKQEISLTSLELKILSLLFSNINKVVSRNYIIEKIWEWTGNDVNDNTVTVYLKRIREKIGDGIIVTIKGIGYRVDKTPNL